MVSVYSKSRHWHGFYSKGHLHSVGLHQNVGILCNCYEYLLIMVKFVGMVKLLTEYKITAVVYKYLRQNCT